MRRFERRDWLIILGLTLAAATLRFWNLGYPPTIIFDETYFAKFAYDYLTNTPLFDAEPPLAKYIIALGEYLFRSNPYENLNAFGWRFMPALFGTAVIPLMYALAKRLFGGVVVPTLAAVFALLDGLLLVESRTALIDIFAVFFNLLTYLLFLLSLQARDKARSIVFLTLAGISLGLGLAVKWITLAFIGTAIVILFVLYFANAPPVKKLFRNRSGKALFDMIGARRENLHHPLLYLLLLGVLPGALYVGIFATHVPFDKYSGQGIWGIHKLIFNYHAGLKETHPYGSAWYTWPFSIRPVAYYFQANENRWQGIIALGNPVLWWSGVLGMAYAVWRFAKRRTLALFLVLFAFVAHFVPWALIPRVLFIYHYLGSLPFVLLALAYAGGQSWQWRPKDASLQLFAWVLLIAAAGGLGGLLGSSLLGSTATGFPVGTVLAALPVLWLVVANVRGLTWGQKQVIAFVGIVALAFVYFYPIWTGVGLSSEDYYRRMWLRSWL